MRRARALLALPVVAVLLAGVVPRADASWTDHEVVRGQASTASSACTTAGRYAARAYGRMVTGSVLGSSFDPAVTLAGIGVVHDGTTATVSPATSTATGSEAWKSPLAVSAIDGAVTASAGASVPLTWGSGTGVYTQYAEAHSTGRSLGASGAITDSGAIDTAAMSAGTAPSVGTLDVSALLQSAGHSAALPNLGTIRLSIGAVASTTSLNGCGLAWNQGLASSLTRSYSVDSLRLVLRDAAVNALRTSLTTASGTVTSKVMSLVGDPGVTTSTEASLGSTAGTGLVAAVTHSLGGLGLTSPAVSGSGTVTITPRASPDDTAAVAAALAETVTDPSGVVSVDFGSGAITIDLASVAALNGRPSNSQALTSAVVGTVQTALAAVLNTHRLRLAAAWSTLRSNLTVRVTASATVTALGVPIATVAEDYSGTVDQFLAGTEPHPTATVTALNALGVSIQSALLANLTGTLGADFFTPVRTAVLAGVPTALDATIAAATSTAGTAVTTATAALPADLAPLSSVVRLTVNSRPDESPFPTSYLGTAPAGRYTETALHVEIRGGTGDDLDLFLASSAAGANPPLTR